MAATERPLKDTDVDELRSRLEVVLNRLDSLFKEVGTRLVEVGNLRGEAGLVYRELVARGVLKEEPHAQGHAGPGTLPAS